jgi:hypothetical protein
MDRLVHTLLKFQVSDPWWRDRRLQTALDHPFMNCSTKILDADNIWVVPPGPSWWQNRLCFDISHDTGADGHRNGQASLRWFMYSDAKEGAHHGVSLTFIPPPLTAQPPFTVETFCIDYFLFLQEQIKGIIIIRSGTVASYLVSHETSDLSSDCTLSVTAQAHASETGS